MKKITFTLIALVVSFFATAQTLEMTYHFDTPTVHPLQGYEQIQFDGCMQSAKAGQPSLPWQQVSLILPEGQEAESIEVYLTDFRDLAGVHELFPYQPSRRYSDPERHDFLKDEALYASKSVYPSETKGRLTTQYLNGVGFAFSSFSPVQYEPATGHVRYAATATVVVRTKASRVDHHRKLWLTPSHRNRVERLAQNPEMLQAYQSRGREISGYELLVITTAPYVSQFDSYVDFYQARGLRTRVVCVDDIYNTMQGSDYAEKIRNYIIQEYEDNGILMVNLGGDVPDIPYRGFYCHVTSGGGNQEDNGLPADLYYAALDGTWNDNNNNRWGEIGEDDLLPEIGVGRMCFSNQNEFDNMMHKSMTYQREPVLGEFRKVIMGGEHLYDDPMSNGSQYLELLIGERSDNGYTTIGIPEDYEFTRLYEEQGNWSGSLLRNAINQGTQYVHHDGHANTTYVAGWYNSDITDANFSGANGVDHNYTFFHSSGCICGDFTETCIMEKMTKIANFAVATIGNSRYGWFNEGQTEGPAIHLARETEDAYYHERIPYTGLALTEAKCQTAPWVTAPGQWEEGALRWNFYDLNIMGDVAVSPWHDEPFTPDVQYQSQLLVGTPNTTVTVTDGNGNGLLNFRCGFFHQGELIGFGMTNADGVAEVVFEPVIDFVDEVSLIVTGSDAWPQTLEVLTLPGNCAYVIYDSYEIADNGNQQADYGETFSLNLNVKNVGSVAAGALTATLTTESPYVTITSPTTTISGMNGGQTVSLSNVFTMSVSDDVPNNTNVLFFLNCSDGRDTWSSKFNMKVYAPDFQMVGINLETTSGILNPGDSGTVRFTLKNNGGSALPSAVFQVYNSHPEIQLGNSMWTYGAIAPGEEFTAEMPFSVSENVEIGSMYELPYAVYHGNYQLTDSYFIAIGQSMEGFETGDFAQFDWHQGSIVTAWETTTESPYEGTYCAKSSAIGDNETSALYITIQVFQNSEISFFKKVSSEASYDKLHFYIDDVEKGNWSGEVAWGRESYDLTPGMHTLKWTYTKDVMWQSGSDCAWIDNVKFPASHIITEVKEELSHGITLFPNPNQGRFSLDCGQEPCTVTVFNSLGQQVYQQEGASGIVELSLDLEKGLYFVIVKSDRLNGIQKMVVR